MIGGASKKKKKGKNTHFGKINCLQLSDPVKFSGIVAALVVMACGQKECKEFMPAKKQATDSVSRR